MFQAMDIGGLGTFTEPTLLMIIRVLGFMVEMFFSNFSLVIPDL